MASHGYGVVVKELRRLLSAGTVAGLSEWHLVERFASARDEAAFEALLARFGPMVLGVCRRMLRDEADVEDAFQATFLVLVRKAGSLGPRDLLGHWLYGVAYRVALRARCQAARRRSHERAGPAAEPSAPADDPARFDLAAVLDAELSRLPAKYRAPIVLCYFEGLTHEEAALRLGWPVGSVKGRLVRARDQLRGRLVRRGYTLPAAALAATLSREATASIPPALAAATIRAAVQTAAGAAAAGVVSASVTMLTRGGLTAMSLTPWKMAGVSVLVLALGAGVVAYQADPRGNGKPAETPAPAALPAARAVPKPLEAQPTADAAADDAPGPKYQAVMKSLDEKVSMSFANETPLEDVLKYIKAATSGPNDTGIPIYVDPEGLEEAKKTMTSPVSIDVEGAPLKSSLHVLLRKLGLDYRVQRDGLLVISARTAILEREVDELRAELAQLKGRWRAANRPPVSSQPSAARLLDKVLADPKTQQIVKKLEEPISMSYAGPTPLEDVLKYIKSATQGPNDTGIPIYVDPVGLNEAEKNMTSPVTLDLEGVPLRITLRLLLKQLGLTYTVKDGLLTITSESSEDAPLPYLDVVERAKRGELSLAEIQELTAEVKAVAELEKAARDLYRLPERSTQ